MRLNPRRRSATSTVLVRWCGPCLLALAAIAGGAAAQSSREAEKKLQQLRGELKDVSQERRKLEGERGDASRRLRDADEKVARTGRAVAEAETAIQREQQSLAVLQEQRKALQTGLDRQRQQLAALLRGAYHLGNNAPLKLLLSQDTVADGNRHLAYHRYLQRERAQTISTLTADLQALTQTEQQIVARSEELKQAREARQKQALLLAEDRKQRALLVSDLDKRYQDRSEREKALGHDARALETLLANLRAAAARADAERRAAARRAAQQQAAEKAAEKGGRSSPARTPPRVVANAAPAPKVGGLGWPLSGNLLARYGGRLPDGRTSSGVLIGAAAGTTVTAVADGTVVFSDWMTGYGMILIVDHGNGYMSLYAHNDALLRDAGARVRRGEAVAKVGKSGGQDMPALYFELRRNGQPVDPSTWLQRQ